MADFNLVRFMDRAEWMADANCLGLDPNLFFPHETEHDKAAKAKTICRGCDVQAECLAYALNANEAHGIWGGTSERERRRIRRARAKDTNGPIPPPTSSAPTSTAPPVDTANTSTGVPIPVVRVSMLTLSMPSSPAHHALLQRS